MPEKLKPCPFCGHAPEVKNTGFEQCRSRENGDLITRWYVWCPNCGIKKDGGISEYWITNDETLKLVGLSSNGRTKAIEAWNRRADNAKV